MSGLLGQGPALPHGCLSQRLGASAQHPQSASQSTSLGATNRPSSSARCAAPSSADAPSSSPPRRAPRLPAPPSLGHRRPSASEQPLPQLHQSELQRTQRTRAASTATSSASTSRSNGKPSPRVLRQFPTNVATQQERQELEARSEGPSSNPLPLPLPLSFLVRQSHSLLFQFAPDSEDESEDSEVDEDDHRLRSRSRNLPATSSISTTTTTSRTSLESIGDAAIGLDGRDARDGVASEDVLPSPLSDWAPGAFTTLRRDSAKAGTADAVNGGVGVQWEDAQGERVVTGSGATSTVTGTATTVTEELQDAGMLVEEMGEGEEGSEGRRQGWPTDSYVRGLMRLWGGLRGHAKAAAIESHEQEQQEEKGEEGREEREEGEAQATAQASHLALDDRDSQQPGLAKADATSAPMAAADMAPLQSDVEAVEEDVGPEEEDVSTTRPKGSVITDHAPPRANVWAIWALMTWRREKQEQQQQQRQVALQARAGGAAVEAPAAPSAAPLAIPDAAPARQLAGASDVTTKAGQAQGGEAAAIVSAVRGSSTCSSCGACQEYSAAAAAAVGGAPGAKAAPAASSVWVPHTPETMAPFLHLASLAELRTAAVLSRLCHLAYTIPVLNEDYLFTQHKMRVVTTSMRKDEVLALQQRARVTAAKAVEADEAVKSLEGTAVPGALLPSPLGNGVQKVTGVISQTYSSTASALASATGKYSLPWGSSDPNTQGKREEGEGQGSGKGEERKGKGKRGGRKGEPGGKEVEGGEEEGEAEATCPCHWYVCDEVKSGTRHFIIQGSESLASWQANLTFDPVPFEDKRLGVVVHRGIYIAAKALYRDLLPLVRSHLAVQGRPRAKIQLAGHSLGGSLSTLLCLMLHLRGEVAPHNMLPVYTFGAPSIMCGGDQLLATLGLPKDHVRQVVMHRDLVPRAFACEYPGHIAEVLRRVSGALRNHPCLLSQRLVYAPMGHMMALQPEEQAAPFHPLLPPRPGLYHLDHPLFRNANRRSRGMLSAPRAAFQAARGRAEGAGGAEGQEQGSASREAMARARGELRSVQLAFLNNPHPLEILADPGSYGTEGSISRDHDPRHYTFALASQARRVVREARREERQIRRSQHWLPLLQPAASPAGALPGGSRLLTEAEARRATERGIEEALLPEIATSGYGGAPAVAPRGLPSLSVGRFGVPGRRGAGEAQKREGGEREKGAGKGTQELEVLPPPPPAPLGVRWGAQRSLAVAAGGLAGAGSTAGALVAGKPALPSPSGSGELQHSGAAANGRAGRGAWGWWFFGRRGDQGGQGQHMLSLLVLLAAAAAANPEFLAVVA